MISDTGLVLYLLGFMGGGGGGGGAGAEIFYHRFSCKSLECSF